MKLENVFRKAHSALLALQYCQAYRLSFRGIYWKLLISLNEPWLQAYQFRTILDIGAHDGSWARTARAAFPNAMIFAVEPLDDSVRGCAGRMQGDARFRVFCAAVGNSNGFLEFQRSSFRPASSILSMDRTKMAELVRETLHSEPVNVIVRRLDDLVADEHLVLEPPVLVKIDVQGYESQVIAGGEKTLRCADVVIVETSFEELYLGQSLFQDVADQLYHLGFSYHGAFDQIISPIDKRILQQDAIFLMNPTVARYGAISK